MIDDKRIEVLESIREMAIRNVKDEDIASQLKVPVYQVSHLRVFLGIRKMNKVQIFDGGDRKISSSNSKTFTPTFSINVMNAEKIGLNMNKTYFITGKILGKRKIELTFNEKPTSV